MMQNIITPANIPKNPSNSPTPYEIENTAEISKNTGKIILISFGVNMVSKLKNFFIGTPPFGLPKITLNLTAFQYSR